MSNLINSSGQPTYGWIKKSVSDVNYLDFPLANTMDEFLSDSAKKRKFNQFHFIGLTGPDLMAGLAIVDLKLVSNCFFYVWTKEEGLVIEKSYLSPLALGASMTTQPDVARSVFSFPGVKAEFLQEGADTQIQLNAKGIEVDVRLSQPERYMPLRVCSQAGYNGWVYTQKSAGLQASGSIHVKGKSYDLNAMKVLGSVDWSCGFMRRETAWNWASFSGVDTNGNVVGLNLASGVNETGTSENGFWLDGKLNKLGGVRFEFDRYNPESKWHVVSDCGRINLIFKPEGLRTEKIDIGLLASNFKQVFGFYSGFLIDDRGVKVDLLNVPGYAEDHYAKW
jgi:hypothetical protein